MLETLKKDVFAANMLLPQHGLVTYTWGNASGIDRDVGCLVIKPSGVPYETMQIEDMVVVDLSNGLVCEGKHNPSSDTSTHIELYRCFSSIGGIVHTHSRWATIFAQARKSIPPLGTTHADYFFGEIPCTRLMSDKEIKGDYELETGKVIIETFLKRNPMQVPAALVANHGPFVWGSDAFDAVHHSVVLEELAFMAWHNQMAKPDIEPIQQSLLEKHYLRKHGKNAYYGQK